MILWLVYSVDNWDGLSKIGKYKVNDKEIITPALFPVVDPFKQDVPISKLKDEFGFDQVITSAYLMSKRLQDKPLEEYPQIHEYLDYNGLVMMDSGAYQVMLYGDIELGVVDTLKLQSHVRPDIGVIMDHPIGLDVSYDEAKKRIDTTLANIKTSIPYFEESGVNWTLPIQGGKYHDLMTDYLQKITKPEIIDNFSFYALGSVVPIMIHQKYETLVKMIATTKTNLPVTKPLHLFGAGHPAMFALATFLGCDSFDSAAYVLMAKDGRYMTVDGTYQLDRLREFPCHCKICVSHTPREVKSMPQGERTKLLAEHNLWVSVGEINRIRTVIRHGRLWDLVQQRAASVPKLASATRMAIDFVSTGELKTLYKAGTPVFNATAVRMMRPVDVRKPVIERSRLAVHRVLQDLKPKKIICIGHKMSDSIYNRSSQKLLDMYSKDFLLCLFLPPFGIIPAHLFDIYPIGQLTHDLDFHHFNLELLVNQQKTLRENGLEDFTLITDEDWPHDIVNALQTGIENFEYIIDRNPMKKLKQLL